MQCAYFQKKSTEGNGMCTIFKRSLQKEMECVLFSKEVYRRKYNVHYFQNKFTEDNAMCTILK
jgi:hypothetical protein